MVKPLISSSYTESLISILESEKSIGCRIAESRSQMRMMGSSYDENHMGMVELYPLESGVSVLSNTDWVSGEMWCKEDMLKLADEIKSFAEDVTQDYIDNYNLQLEAKRKFELERIEERNKQRAEEKKQREIPKSGLILLIRYPNSLYRFTYSTSLSLQAKIENIKVQEGDNIQIIHSLETHDTLKFYHKFIKTQFSSRLEGRYYHLTDEDVQYFSDEKFPANAMEWFQGPSIIEEEMTSSR